MHGGRHCHASRDTAGRGVSLAADERIHTVLLDGNAVGDLESLAVDIAESSACGLTKKGMVGQSNLQPASADTENAFEWKSAFSIPAEVSVDRRAYLALTLRNWPCSLSQTVRLDSLSRLDWFRISFAVHRVICAAEDYPYTMTTASEAKKQQGINYC